MADPLRADPLRVVIAEENHFGPARVAASGLWGLADRIEAPGGRLCVVDLPLPEDRRG